MTQKKCRMQRLGFYSALCILVLVLPCSAQMPRAPGGLKLAGASLDGTSYDQRTDAFRRLLFELRFEPLGSFAELEINPSESLFIMLGDPRCLAMGLFREGLHSFIEQGGAALIATDMMTKDVAGEKLSGLAGVTVTGETLVIRRNSIPDFVPDIARDVLYSNDEYCPFVRPVEDTKLLGAVAALIGAGSRPDLFRRDPDPKGKPLRVATNAPSYLKLSDEGLPTGIHPLARLPEICQNERINPTGRGSPNGDISVDKDGPLFAVGGTVGKGRVLVLADHSIFINRMILPQDNNNLEFAANCLHWLRGGAATTMEGIRALNSPDALRQLAGTRNKVLFWDDGQIQSNFDVPLKSVPVPPSMVSEPAIVAAIDKTIAKLEENDSFNHALLDWMNDLPGGRTGLARTAVYLLTVAAILFLGYRFLWRSRHRPELATPLLSKTLREHEPKASLLDQRRRALLRSGNVWEMGHRLARECFESAGVALISTAPPGVLMTRGSRWQRWRVNRRVARLWRLARGYAPRHLSPTALQHRLREIEELKTALTNGTITLG